MRLFRQRQAECPFHLQAGNLRCTQARRTRGLKTGVVRRVDSPAVPHRAGCDVAHRRIARTLVRHILRIRNLSNPKFAPSQICCQHFPIVVRQALNLRMRRLGKRCIHRLRCHLPQPRSVWRLLVLRALMAACAFCLEQPQSDRRLRKRPVSRCRKH